MSFDPCRHPVHRRAPALVRVPEWDEAAGMEAHVAVRPMTAGERDQFEHAVLAAKHRGENTRIRARLVSLVLVDDRESERLCPAGEPGLSMVESWDAAAVERIFEAAARLNRLLPEDARQLGEPSPPAA